MSRFRDPSIANPTRADPLLRPVNLADPRDFPPIGRDTRREKYRASIAIRRLSAVDRGHAVYIYIASASCRGVARPRHAAARKLHENYPASNSFNSPYRAGAAASPYRSTVSQADRQFFADTHSSRGPVDHRARFEALALLSARVSRRIILYRASERAARR